jgi:predicted acylesterase/phospholipase RssA
MPEIVPMKLQCDLVMRGGIASGLVYPRAIAKLAETYDFRSIGGTSVGAVAAAGTAAAALGTKTGQDHFRTRLKQLPEELSEIRDGKTVLERLFQPQLKTRRLFRVLMAGLRRENTVSKVGRIVALLCLNYLPIAVLGAAIVFIPLLSFALTSTIKGAVLWVLIVLALIPALIFVVLTASIGALCDVFWRLPKNSYGMCSGTSNFERDKAGVLPLTDWLHELFQNVANRPLDEPVTFGHLWNNGGDTEKERDIELVLMTTNITRGISHRFPFLEGSWGQLFFRKAEFEELFPQSVVNWIMSHSAPVRHEETIEVSNDFYPLPAAPDLPILLGARMSLSFPILLSAVPLYAANVTRRNEQGKFELERCWFSDGGLTSNFPIHFFDAPLPSRPTFGINLVPENVAIGDTEEQDSVMGLRPGGEPIGESHQDRWKNIYMPSTNASGIGSVARFNEFTNITGFFSALFDTARNWNDTELMAMPGYRDRVVHVALAADEGGLNLRMPVGIIARIAERGERAAELLAARFAFKPKLDPQNGKKIKLTWDNHRWVRFRSFLAAFEDVARRFRGIWEDAERQRPFRPYKELLGRSSNEEPTSYPLKRPTQLQFVRETVGTLVDLVAGWTGDRTFDRGKSSKEGRSPRPKPILRMMPPGSNDPRVERATVTATDGLAEAAVDIE